MIAPGLPANERERLRALDEYDILDTPEESAYDAFTALAREIAGTDVSLISFVDERRQWFKSHLGLFLRETPREQAFCNHVVAEGRSLIVEDATRDKRFEDNPLVTGEPRIRFYAGVPLTTPDGYNLGTLCVLDSKPKKLDDHQLHVLAQLADVLVGVMEGRRRFLSLFDAANIDLFTIDPADGSILFASRGACKRLGYERKQLIGMPVYDVIPSIQAGEVADIVARARRQQQIVRETELVRSDGSSYPVELRIDMTMDAGEERILAIATDLTQRKEQQREIDLLLGAINVAGDVILVYDAAPDGQLHLSYMNDAYFAQTGYTPAEALGKSLESFRQSMPDDEGMRAVRAAIAAGTATEAEIVSYRKDGTTYWNQVTLHPISDKSGTISHWIAIERDISDVVARTSALAEEHDRLLALTRAARRIFAALDVRSIVATVNDVVHSLLGATGRVLAVHEDGRAVAVSEIGSADWEKAHKDEIAAQSVKLRARIVDEGQSRAVAYGGQFGENAYALEIRVHPAHALRNTDLFVFDLVSEYFAAAARNVALYQELEERRSAVLELNQTKSDLIAMLAHDFRGPLTSIVGFADLVGEVGDANEEQLEFLDTIKRSAMQLSELATDTLTLSRLERNELTLQLGSVDVGELLESIAQQYADRRAVALTLSGDLHVTADLDRLRQVFANLIDNAIKYSPGGGEPKVFAEGRGDEVVVRVVDRGIGIPAGELSRVFDRFSRASNARKMHISGTGFGLFLSKQLVQLHGGTIAVESEEGAGSTFVVALPRQVHRRAAPRTVVVLDPARESSFLEYGLQEAGYRVMGAASLEETLSIADTQPVDVLILNVGESIPSAEAVKFRTLSKERSIPIVAISNATIPRLSPAATLQYPVLIGDVVAALDRLLDPVKP